MLKGILLTTCGVSLALTLAVSAQSKQKDITIKYWSWSHTLDPYIKDFEGRHPHIHVKFSQFPYQQMSVKVMTSLRSRHSRNTPDVVAAEAGFVGSFIRKGIFQSLDDFGFKKYKKDITPYVWNTGLNSKGNLVAVSWQATPGAFYYRRSLAKKYFGTDDPNIIGKKMDTEDKFLKFIAKTNSGKKKYYYMMDISSSLSVVQSKYRSPLVKDKHLVTGEMMNNLFSTVIKVAKLGAAKKVENNSDIANTIISGKAFGYLLAPWFTGAVLQVYVPKQSGDWAVVAGPYSFSRGGTWLGMSRNVKDPEKKKAVALFLKELAFDKNTSKNFVKSRGDFPANKLLLNDLKDTTTPYLKNQASLSFLSTNADKIFQSPTTYDGGLSNVLQEIYQNIIASPNDYTVSKAIAEYKQQAKEVFPELNIK